MSVVLVRPVILLRTYYKVEGRMSRLSDIPYRYIVFTDASYKRHGEKGYCGYGVAILNTETKEYGTFGDYVGERTIVYGEGWAINRGIKQALKLVSKQEKVGILVVTDSKLSVQVHCKFIPHKWDLSDWHNWRTVKGKYVKNQEIYRNTVELVQRYPNVHIRMAHIHSHMGMSNSDKIKEDLSKHGIRADKDTVKMFMTMNDTVDRIAQDYVEKAIKRQLEWETLPALERVRK